MALSSPPSLPSFDPAIELHSQEIDEPILPPSNSNSDDLEALHEQAQELIQEKTRQGIVIQHRGWRTNEPLRSDDIFNPETPTRVHKQRQTLVEKIDSSEPDNERNIMTFTSSPVHYPPSSSPPLALQKRKRPEPTKSSPKKRRIIAGFLEDDSDGEDNAPPAIVPEPLPESLEPENNDPNAQEALEPELPPSRLPLAEEPAKKPFLAGVSLLRASRDVLRVKTSSGKQLHLRRRVVDAAESYESIIAARSVSEPGKAKQSYYGIEVHKLMDDAKKELKAAASRKDDVSTETLLPSVEVPGPTRTGKHGMTKMWTEKYRAKRFTDLVGDERTHRQVLKWLKGWDPVVFPGSHAPKLRKKPFENADHQNEERQMRKIMLLTGPPGLGKTTLAHVCAKQAGYEVLEINASDERSRDVVKGRIKDALGTENVRGVNTSVNDKTIRKAGKPVCVVVDEVDGVVAGSGGSGEGGFIKALIDLVQLDQINSKPGEAITTGGRKKRGDNFRLLRPLILICNDVYHPSLRPLRASSIAEIVHVRKPPLDKVINRLKAVLDHEGIACEHDGVRRLCESTWGIGSRKQGQANSRGSGEGDIRGVLVAGEWAARKLRSTSTSETPRLTRKWVEEHLIASSTGDSDHASRGLGRGGVREVVERVFLQDAGISTRVNASATAPDHGKVEGTVLGVADIRKRATINALREMLNTTGEYDRCLTDCFSTYPTQVFQDDTFLSKPNAAYDWLHFHDSLSGRVFGSQEWELSPYLPQATLAFHDLFAAVGRNVWDSDRLPEKDDADAENIHPFSGLRADFTAHEALRKNEATLSEFQSSFSPSLMRLFRSLDSVATELLPNLMKMTAPDIRPVVVGGSAGSTASVRNEAEKQCVTRGVRVMSGFGIKFDKARVEFEGPGGHGGWVYRMEPPLDEVSSFYNGKTGGGISAPVRYAVRQVLDQELRKEFLRQRADAKQARYAHGGGIDDTNADEEADKENMINNLDGKSKSLLLATAAVKRDFFGRIINEARPIDKGDAGDTATASSTVKAEETRVWVSFHEGYSNAVRKPITMKELLSSFV